MSHGSGTARRTALYDAHVAAGAKLVDFAGWAMPIQYAGIVQEHRRVRETVGLFDVSHMGEFMVEGTGALESLERITTNRVSDLDIGRVQYSALCYEHGGFIDDLLVYRLDEGYMLVVNAANKDKDLEWVLGHVGGGTEVRDVSEETALIAIQGPCSQPVLSRVTDGDLEAIGYYHSASADVAGRPVLVSRTGYTGEDGFEIYCGLDQARPIWDALMEAGAEDDVEPVGLGCRDTLRLEMGYALYGNDIDDTRTPVEAGLLWITKLKKGDFIGRDAIQAAKDGGARERLIGFELEGRGVARHGHTITGGGRAVGTVTSGTFSPSLERAVGLGYVSVDWTGDIAVDVRGRTIQARRVGLPFYKKGSVRRGA